MEALKINDRRLWNRLMEMAAIGATPKGGVCRVALTDEDKQGRELFIKWAKDAGCEIDVDKIGNIYARRKGKNNDLPAVMIGSHLDSQPTGGKFDGVMGVLAGLEVIETLNDLNLETDVPIEVVSWTNEEGARFSPAMIASGVFSGAFSLEYAYSRMDAQGRTLGEELQRIGFLGDAHVGNRPYKATFELHIEQGPILESNETSIGVVTGVQGIRWYDLSIKGKETHAGPFPLSHRKDTVKKVSALLPEIYKLAEAYSPDSRVTIGYLNTSPGVRNTVPGSLEMSIDLRHPDNNMLMEMDEGLKSIVKEAMKDGFDLELNEVWYSPPVKFDENCVAAVRKASEKLHIEYQEMVSGAGHDSVYISQVAPTSMIFIPCKDGLSHNELESAKKQDVTKGCNVLLNAVLQMANNK
ncbi:Zn-dependent hydrolase [Galbibacter sp. BG1]|nr:Zn-dependent hydrolase [Galbibacter sp. BG1]